MDLIDFEARPNQRQGSIGGLLFLITYMYHYVILVVSSSGVGSGCPLDG